MLLTELMKIPIFKTSRIAAGEIGLSRPVHSVNMMDAPDIINFLKPHELLLSTAYVIKDDPQALRTLIINMNQVGCAGLAIKTKRFLSEIPLSIVSLANELHFPIIELPLEHTLGDVLTESVSHILEKRTHELKYALESHRSFTDLVLSGQGIPEIISALSHLLGSPVMLFDVNHNSIAASPHFHQSSYQEAVATLKELLTTFLPNDPAKYLCLLQPTDFPYRQFVIHPIPTDQLQGFLVTFSDEKLVNPLPELAVEQAINVIRFELLKKQAVKERSRRYKNEFFSDLVEGFFTSNQEVLHRGKKYGLSDQRLSFCIVVKSDNSDMRDASGQSPYDKEGEGLDHFYELVKRGFSSIGVQFAIFNKTDTIVLVASVPWKESREHEIPSGLEDKLYEAIVHIEADSGIAISVGVGKPVEKLLDCPITYKEAVEALHYGYRSKKQRFVQFYSGREPIDLLRLLPNKDLVEYYERTFAGLAHLEIKEKGELLRTLNVYLDNHGQIVETSKRLYIHRNTVLYRLNKLQQLTGYNFNMHNDTMRFRLAFLIEPLLDDATMNKFYS